MPNTLLLNRLEWADNQLVELKIERDEALERAQRAEAEVERLQRETILMQAELKRRLKSEAALLERAEAEMQEAWSDYQSRQRRLKEAGKPVPTLLEQMAELETQVADLHGKLEQAAAREAVLIEFLSRVTWLADGESAFPTFCDGKAYRCISCGRSEFEIGAEGHAVGCEWVEARGLLKDASLAGTALLKRLERLAELETQVADLETDTVCNAKMLAHQCDLARVAETETAELRAALQAALLPLERAADALVPDARGGGSSGAGG